MHKQIERCVWCVYVYIYIYIYAVKLKTGPRLGRL